MCVEFDVFHDGQFWVGVLTLTEGSCLRAAKVVFGTEPSDAELHTYLLRHGGVEIGKMDFLGKVQ